MRGLSLPSLRVRLLTPVSTKFSSHIYYIRINRYTLGLVLPSPFLNMSLFAAPPLLKSFVGVRARQPSKTFVSLLITHAKRNLGSQIAIRSSLRR
jgi:hypothetical protein